MQDATSPFNKIQISTHQLRGTIAVTILKVNAFEESTKMFKLFELCFLLVNADIEQHFYSFTITEGRFFFIYFPLSQIQSLKK